MKIDCYLICSTIPSRKIKLKSQLEKLPNLNLIFINGIYLMEDKNLNLDSNLMRVKYGRTLSLGELGNTLVHMKIFKLIQKSNNPSIILEDDARIQDPNLFINTILSFSELNKSSFVLNLYDTRFFDAIHRNKKLNFSQNVLKIYGVTERNVGYFIDPVACQKYLKNNLPIYSTLDWPYAKVSHYILSNPVVLHGDEETFSTIDLTNKLNRNKKNSFYIKFLYFSFYYYFINKKFFLNFWDYFEKILFNKIFFYIDIVYIKVKSIFLSR